ncbi:visceral mesodermal armadillo-repeats [Arctopsyche grandis]|uniref:visceral mesodermal armadillo-repeats n=1 Tax=Arctopsyche grandis TaxID=121162 RepID=UPI00406D9D4E
MENKTSPVHIEFIELLSKQQTEEINTKIKSILESIISEGAAYAHDVIDPLTLLLKRNDIDIQRMTAQAIAEICKCEKKRTSYAHADIIKPLLSFLNKPIDNSNAELMKQACRGLGNVCFDSHVGRDLVLNSSGIQIVVDMLPKTLQCNDPRLTTQCHSVRLFTCKLLSILMFGGSDYIQPALDVDFMDKIHDVIQYEFTSPDGDDNRLNSALLVVSVVTEYNRSLVVKDEFTLMIVDILKTIKNIDISEVCLEYLHYQAEHDEVKTVLAKAAVPQILWSLLQQHRALAVDEETRELMKLACDLIALILTGDESMNILYADGSGEFYLSMIDSLSSDDVELAITSILAIGNFARTDTHCMHMMDTGVFVKLMSILLLHKSHEDDIRLQHVVLSSLRNLVIPQRNKSLAIKHGILPLLIEMVPNVNQYYVVFKLVATLRMLVDGQENVAKDLLSVDVLKRVSVWGAQSEHAGVSGEASRLLARMVRQLQSQESLTSIVKVDGCVACLVNMLAASHIIMQNEAMIALTILCATIFRDSTEAHQNNNEESRKRSEHISICDQDETRNILIDGILKAELAKQLNIMLERNRLKVQPEIVENICKFISLLMMHEPLKEQMSQLKVQESMQTLLTENDQLSESLKNSISDLIAKLDMTGCESLQ